MKKPIKIIKYKDGTFGAKKMGWFGWKYLNEIYDGNWCWHYSWCYHVPDGIGLYDKFKSYKDCLLSLRKYFHGHRMLVEE